MQEDNCDEPKKSARHEKPSFPFNVTTSLIYGIHNHIADCAFWLYNSISHSCWKELALFKSKASFSMRN